MAVDVLVIQSVIFFLSLAILYKAAENVIESVIVIARFFRISDVAAGFLIISIATTFPEIAVSVMASVQGETSIVVGNVFGSIIANLALVLGFTVIMAGVVKYSNSVRGDLVGILVAMPVIAVVLLTGLFSEFYGIGLVSIFIIYAYYSVQRGKADGDGHRREKPVGAREAVLNAMAFGFAVCIVLVSAKFAVDSAIAVATIIGVSKAFVGATAIALGTSLPELAVNYVAVKKRRTGIALGNLVGASMMNLTLVLGIAALISPLSANVYAFSTLVAFMILVSATLCFFLRQGNALRRGHGLALLLLYALFLAMSIWVEIFT